MSKSVPADDKPPARRRFGPGALAALRARRRAALPPVGGPEEIARAADAIAAAETADGDAFLAFTGDKRFIWSESGASFLMFGAAGRAWIAVGGPVGARSEFDELAARFVATARTCRAFPAFYAVSAEEADALAVHKLRAHKVGERAVVDLSTFKIAGKDMRGLRNERNRALRAGCTFEVRAPGPLGGLEPELKAVSDAWLTERGGLEKTFSLGRFDPGYLSRFHLALVRRQGVLVAFANVWAHGGLVTMDLMRFSDEEDGGGMDYLFSELALWAQARGASRLDLGLAPLAGLRDQPSPTMAARLGSLIYARGGRFYGFEGLRAFKDKFDPVWEPAFIVARNQWRAGAAAIGVASLTGGGMRQLLRRTRAEGASPNNPPVSSSTVR